MTTSVNRSVDKLKASIGYLLKNANQSSQRDVAEINKAYRTLKSLIQQYEQLEMNFHTQLTKSKVRQLKIVNPNMSEAQLAEITSDILNQQIFAKTILKPRCVDSQNVLDAVTNRHRNVEMVLQQLATISEMYTKVSELVGNQESAVTVIEQRAEEVPENVECGNEHLQKGAKSARARNRKKWWCLLVGSMFPLLYYYKSCRSLN